jgi:L-threonylcarbamoyladenylate synthase
MEMISNTTQDEIKKAAQALRDGHLVAFPTETVYGLGADATNEKAVARIYSVKGRPTDHPLIVHISSINQLNFWVSEVSNYAIELARNFWPGPLTLILKRSDRAKNFITGGQDNVALRVPSNSLALLLLKEFENLGGNGIAAPSANRFGAVSPTTCEAVKEELDRYLLKQDLILNGGSSSVGVESTIVDCTNEQAMILRPGVITEKMIKTITNVQIQNFDLPKIRTSGAFASHYSPKAEVVLNGTAKKGDGFLALSSFTTPTGAIRLASPSNIEDYAKELYEALRLGDRKRLKRIVVLTPNGEGLALAIRDRLNKSAGSIDQNF